MSNRYVNSENGIEVVVSWQAAKMIGPSDVPRWVAKLTEFMVDVGLKWAYVSKCGSAVIVNLVT